MNNTAFILLISLMFISCSKPPAPYVEQYPKYQHYQASHLARFENIKVFTAAGELTDEKLTQQYAAEFNNYFYTPFSTYTDPSLVRFTLVREDSMSNSSRAPYIEVKRTAVDQYDSYTGKGRVPVPDTASIHRQIGRYKPVLKENSLSSGYTYFDCPWPEYYLKQAGDSLSFPIIRYLLFAREQHLVRFSADRTNNVFSPAVFSSIMPGDTLMIQAFELVMKKIN
jgi:hypothetical protein